MESLYLITKCGCTKFVKHDDDKPYPKQIVIALNTHIIDAKDFDGGLIEYKRVFARAPSHKGYITYREV